LTVSAGKSADTVREAQLKVKIDCQFFLLHLTDDQMVIEVEGDTIKECLEQLVAKYPKVKKWLYREDGEIANYLDIFVNLESTLPNQISDPVKDGDVIYIVMMHTAG
jgi:molybdopterin converting factor small subunit